MNMFSDKGVPVIISSLTVCQGVAWLLLGFTYHGEWIPLVVMVGGGALIVAGIVFFYCKLKNCVVYLWVEVVAVIALTAIASTLVILSKHVGALQAAIVFCANSWIIVHCIVRIIAVFKQKNLD